MVVTILTATTYLKPTANNFDLEILKPILTTPPICEQIDYNEVKTYVDQFTEIKQMLIDIHQTEPCPEIEACIRDIDGKIDGICDLCQQLCSIFLFQSMLSTQKNDLSTLYADIPITNDPAIQQMLQMQQQQIINNLMAQMQESNQNFQNKKWWKKTKIIVGLVIGAATLGAISFVLHQLYYGWFSGKLNKINKQGKNIGKKLVETKQVITKVKETNKEMLEAEKKILNKSKAIKKAIKKAKVKQENYIHVVEAVRGDHENIEKLQGDVKQIVNVANFLITELQKTQTGVTKLKKRADYKSLDVKDIKKWLEKTEEFNRTLRNSIKLPEKDLETTKSNENVEKKPKKKKKKKLGWLFNKKKS